MPTIARGFPLFPKLPTELREAIWRLCLPYRVSELDLPVPDLVFDKGQLACELQATTQANNLPPLVSRVCHESRSVAFKAGSILSFDNRDPPLEARWSSNLMMGDRWRDRARGSVHLNWQAVYEAEWDYTDGSPLHALAWETSQVSRGGSLTIEYLEDSCLSTNELDLGPRPRMGYPMRHLDRFHDLEALKQRSDWLVVMHTIVIHCDLKKAVATDLFGLFGDARVHVISVAQEAKIEAFLTFAETCERQGPVTVRQSFHRQSAGMMKQRLRKVVMEQFQSEELMAAVRPAIMFRLCTRMCNHVN